MHVTGTVAAAEVIEQVRTVRSGVLTITIGTGCCESTAPFLYEDFWPGPDQAVVGEVAGVPVYAPEYLRKLYPDADGVVVDVVLNVSAESLSVETEFDCRLILRSADADFGIDVGADDVCIVRPTHTSPSVATGGASQVTGAIPEHLQRLRMR